MRLLLALLLALFAAPAVATAQPVPAAAAARPLHVLPFELYDSRIYVEVSGPGFGPAWFIVDSGAQLTHFTSELASRARLTTGGRVGISGTGPGRVQGVFVRPVTLRIGTLALPVRRGVASPAEATFGAVFAGSGRRFEGVVGYDLFDAYAVEIDYAAREIRLYPPGSTAAGAPIRILDSKPYVEAVLEVGGAAVPALLQLDTGFGGAISLNARFVERQRLLDRAGTLLPAWSRGVGGIAEARTARFGALRVGGFTLPAPIASLALVQGSSRADSAGRLGGDLFRRLTIRLDYAGRRVSVAPGAAFAEPFEADMSGLSLVEEGGTMTIWHVAGGTPAAAAGIAAGDRLLAIDGAPPPTLEAARLALRSDGATRRLRLLRGGREIEAVLTLRRRL